MERPKYNFFVGKKESASLFYEYMYINSDGEYYETTEGRYATGKIEISGDAVYFDMTVACAYGCIFFYDKNEAYIKNSYLRLSSYKGTSIPFPEGAKYYAIAMGYVLPASLYRLEYQEFLAKKDEGLIYSLKRVVPHYKELSKKFAKENNQAFFRESLSGKITVFGEDFDYIHGSRFSTKFLFLIEKVSSSGAVAPYFSSSFTKADCKIDYEKRSCQINPTAHDQYTKILAGYENTYDLIKLAPDISKIKMSKRPAIQIYINGSSTISTYLGNTYWESDVQTVVSSHSDLINTYHFAYNTTGSEFNITGSSWEGVNGKYAGTGEVWVNENGYTAYVERTSTTSLYIYIKRDSDGAVMYKSVWEQICTPGIEYGVNMGTGSGISMAGAGASGGSEQFILEDAFSYYVYERMLCDVEALTDGTATYALGSSDMALDNRNYKRCVGVTGDLIFSTRKVTDEPTQYGTNDDGYYFTNKFLPSTAGVDVLMPICRSRWVNSSLWYAHRADYAGFEQKGMASYTLNDSFSIAGVINALLKKIDPTVEHKADAEYSQFLYGSTFPLIGADRFYVFLTQKTNILKSDYDTPARKAETTLKAIMDMLRTCFGCYWYVEDRKFKIEHLYYFNNGGTYPGSTATAAELIDLTSLKDQFNKKQFSYFQSELSFDKTDLACRYEFGWPDDCTDLFGNLSVDVKDPYTQDKTESVSPNGFAADIDFMFLAPDDISDDGFALLCPIKSTSDAGAEEYVLPMVTGTFVNDEGTEYTARVQNYYASWPFLVRLYMYDMPGTDIECNHLNNLASYGVKKCMQQAVEFFAAEDLSVTATVKTPAGVGAIEDYSVNIDTRLAKVNLIYAPE